MKRKISIFMIIILLTIPLSICDNLNPIVNLDRPNDGDDWESDSVTFSYNVTDADNITNCLLNIDGTIISNDTNIKTGAIQDFVYQLTNGTHLWYIKCKDNYSNVGRSASRSFVVLPEQETSASPDDIPEVTPEEIRAVFLESPEDSEEVFNNTVNLTYSVVTDGDISNCSLFVDGNFTSINSTIIKNIDQVFKVWLSNGTHNWYVECKNSTDSIKSATFEFSIGEYFNEDINMTCMQKAEDIRKEVDDDRLESVENIISVMNLICTVQGTITSIISTVNMIIGFTACCWNPFAMEACMAQEAPHYAVNANWWGTGNHICMFLNGGWCGLVSGIYGEGNQAINVAGKMISPYDSIYIAYGCLSIIGIFYHMRMERNIKLSKACCIEAACKTGTGTEVCEKMERVATCTYIQGGLYRSMIKGVFATVAALVVGTEAVGGSTEVMPNCISVALNIANIPSIFDGVISAYDWMTKPMPESCEDYGYKEAIEDAEAFPDPYYDPSQLAAIDTEIDKVPEVTKDNDIVGVPTDTGKDDVTVS